LFRINSGQSRRRGVEGKLIPVEGALLNVWSGNPQFNLNLTIVDL
jgi:hypothetical protein